jgi:3-oxoacyl-[acyl-carrier protein] reductase
MDFTMGKLAGKVAVVTGASKGIGAGIAKALAAEGAAVVVNYATSKEWAERVVAAIAASGGRAIAVQADVSKQADIVRLFRETIAAFGQIDVLVNNAGVYKFVALEETTEELMRAQFGLNVFGLLLAIKEAVKHFGADGGSIVNISSSVTTLYPAGSASYTASKAAVDAMTIVLSKELGPRGIRVNCICPGGTVTEGMVAGGFGGEYQRHIEANAPLRRIGQVEDVASVAVFLAGSDSKYVTGQVINVAGGMR